MKKLLAIILSILMLAPYAVEASLAFDDETQIVSISAEPVYIYENTRGDMTWEWVYNEETYDWEQGDEYYRYYTYDNLYNSRFTVTFSDGTEETYDYWGLRSLYNYDYDFEYADDQTDEQSYDNQWGVGSHYVKYRFNGVEFELEVVIEEMPFVSIETDGTSFYEKTRGYYTGDWIGWDDENQKDIYTEEYFKYDVYDILNYYSEYTVTYKDGSKETLSADTLCERYGNYSYSIQYDDDQSYDNQWDAGEHNVNASFLGIKFTAPIMIEELPIVSITASPVTYKEERNGWWTNDEIWDDETQSYIYTEDYFRYSISYYDSEYTVTFRDSHTETFGYDELISYFGDDYSFSGSSDQSYDNQWKPGEQHSFTVTYFGVEFEIPVKIVTATKPSSIEVVRMPNKTEYYEGYTDFDSTGMILSITWTDGSKSTEEFTYNSSGRYCYNSNGDFFYLNISCEGENVTLYFNNGVETGFKIALKENPVSSISGVYTGELISGWSDNVYISTSNSDIEYTVGLKNGMSVTGDYYYISNYFGYSGMYGGGSSDTSSTGTKSVGVSFLGAEGEITYEVKESPVSKLEIVEMEELDVSKKIKRSYYSSSYEWPLPDFRYRVTMKDGEVFEDYFDSDTRTVLSDYDDNDLDGTFEKRATNYYYSKTFTGNIRVTGVDMANWDVGLENKMNVNYLGCTVTVNVTIDDGLDFTYIVQDNEAIITSCKNTALTDIVIPSEIEGVPVVGVSAIFDDNYYAQTSVKSVTFPDSVRFIDEKVFAFDSAYNSRTVKTITFGKGISLITAKMLEYCPSLESVIISDDNPYYSSTGYLVKSKETGKPVAYIRGGNNENTVTEDGVTYLADKSAVIKCDSEKAGDYVMPESVEFIASGAFANCKKLESVKLSSGVTEITYMAFSGCSSLKSIELPDSVISIGDRSFESSGLESLDLPSGLETIGVMAFYAVPIKSLALPNSVAVIKESAFGRCSSLETVTTFGSAKDSYDIPEENRVLANGAFSFCSALTDIAIPDGLCTVTQNSIYNSSSLKNITLGAGVKEFAYSYYYFEGLENIFVSPGNTVFKDVNGVLYSHDMKDLVVCPREKTAVAIPAGVENISDSAFLYCNSLKTVEFPGTLKKIGDSAFYSCSGFSCSTLPDSVESIGACAFYECKKLTGFSLPASLKGIGDYAFCNCEGITNIVLPGSIETVGDFAFYGTKIEKLDLPEGLKKIGALGLRLDSIEFPSTIEELTNNQFSDSPNMLGYSGAQVTNIVYGIGIPTLKDITVPDKAISIGTTKIEGTEWYESQPDGQIYLERNFIKYKGAAPSDVTLKNGTLTIADGAFAQNGKLESVTMPGTVERIGKYSFMLCKRITDVDLSENLKTIEDFAFYGCSGITEIAIPKNVKYIGSGAFWDCKSLEKITVDSGNPYFKSVDGVLYSKDGTELLFVPPAKKGELILPDSVVKIAPFAVSYSSLTSVTVNNAAAEFGDRAIGYSFELVPDSRTTVPYHYTSHVAARAPIIVGKVPSTAYDYAIANGLAFDAIDDNTRGIINGVEWFFDPESKTLTLSGEGVLEINDAPWNEFAGQIEKIKIGNAINFMSANAFGRLSGVKSFELDGEKDEWTNRASLLNSAFRNAKLVYSDGEEPEPDPSLPGDVNGDGDITMKDVLKIRRFIAGLDDLSPEEQAIADVNGDGDVTMKDVLKIRRYIAGLDTEL